MKKFLTVLLVLVMLMGIVCIASAKVNLILWTKEGEEALDWNKSLIEEFMKANPNITIELVKKTNVEVLRLSNRQPGRCCPGYFVDRK